MLLPLDPSLESDALRLLNEDGVVRLVSILPGDLCDRLLESINSSLAKEIELGNELTRETGFGNVHSRDYRWDVYLRNEGVYKEALGHMLGGDTCVLSRLFSSLFGGEDAEFHEFSALISDPGAVSQPIHPDSVYTERAPLYTVFIALQDVEPDMGATIFLPRTNTAHYHDQHNKKPDEKIEFLATCEYRQCLARKGDAVIMVNI